MTDAELAEIEAAGLRQPSSSIWYQDVPALVRELRAARAELAALKRESVFGVMRECERERTAATLLAALTRERPFANSSEDNAPDECDGENVAYAVALADALRAKLKEAP